MPVTEIYILVPHLLPLRALVREKIPNTIHTRVYHPEKLYIII